MDLGDDIEPSEQALERLTERREELNDDVETLEREIESMEDDTFEEIFDFHNTANQVDYDLSRLEEGNWRTSWPDRLL